MINIYGTDINRDWSFDKGDINLVSDTLNLGQAIVNRLNADLDTYSIFYPKYGGDLFEHMGELNHPTIPEYIRIEIETILSQEPRIANLECTVDKNSSNSIECTLNITPIGSDEVVEINLVINEDSYIQIVGTTSEINEVRL